MDKKIVTIIAAAFIMLAMTASMTMKMFATANAASSLRVTQSTEDGTNSIRVYQSSQDGLEVECEGSNLKCEIIGDDTVVATSSSSSLSFF
jgi:hypothetical protein